MNAMTSSHVAALHIDNLHKSFGKTLRRVNGMPLLAPTGPVNRHCST